MIDFRYHLVSIVAIFLALATGIVLGTTVLQEPALQSARQVTDTLNKETDDLRGQLDVLRKRERGNDSFVAALTQELVSGRLAGQRVVLVEVPGLNSSLREQQEQVLTQAGAAVTGRIALTEAYTDPKSTLLDQLSAQFKPAAVAFPENASQYQKAATVLGAALMGKEDAATPVAGTTLAAFEQAGVISVEEEITDRATLAVIFAPETVYSGENADTQAGAIVELASGLDAAGRGAVVTATAAATAPGGLIAAVRDDSEAAAQVSTVDSLDMPSGRVVVVYALREQIDGGAGQYGIGTGGKTFQPPVASPSPTPTGG
ncbi:copper transporter [Thermoactinospora rubra]|uniref:copper transporter n=1 Tax=Thermoactinospora rubra TaxID=1088767 RepID=UPI000A104C1C|nr:copper transporter [Thermoactinospora rubra]